ncbi:unnamed protein product [Arabidopsis arenosa]|uniref:Di19 zinc-binding domain-containing protein n=1 Tax=Arabidopsis arenosa TaxID=38785 RepID=A0A8S1ZK20_ARAAE|nr:unnamed protein product [Arabidopsis arenosa]
MDADSKRFLATLRSRSEMLMGFEEIDGDDDFQEEFACPFCAESYDIIGLCCHIDDEHTLESKNAVCPVCSLKVGVDIVAHITLHHGTKEKVTEKWYQFDTFTSSERAKRRRSTEVVRIYFSKWFCCIKWNSRSSPVVIYLTYTITEFSCDTPNQKSIRGETDRAQETSVHLTGLIKRSGREEAKIRVCSEALVISHF